MYRSTLWNYLGLGQWIAIICFTFLVLNVSAVNADELTHISIQITGDSEISLDSLNRIIRASIEIESFDPRDGYYYMRVVQLSTGEILTESEIFPKDITNEFWATKIAYVVDENIENVIGDYEIQIFTEFGTATAKTKFSVVESAKVEVQNLTEEQPTEPEPKIPNWVRNIFIWYAEDRISEKELLEAIKFLIEVGIIQVSN